MSFTITHQDPEKTLLQLMQIFEELKMGSGHDLSGLPFKKSQLFENQADPRLGSILIKLSNVDESKVESAVEQILRGKGYNTCSTDYTAFLANVNVRQFGNQYYVDIGTLPELPGAQPNTMFSKPSY